MHRVNVTTPLVVLATLAAPAAVAAQTTTAAPQAVTVVGHAADVSRRDATVRFDLSDGNTKTLSLRRGRIYLDGEEIGEYPDGSILERAWRALATRAADLSAPEMALAVHVLPVEGLSPEAAGAWRQAVAEVPTSPVGARVAPPPPPMPSLPAIAGIDTDALAAEIQAAVAEARRVRVIDRVPRPEANFSAGGVLADVMGLLGMLVALGSIGFGAVFFVPQRLEIVADTVAQSPVRAFFAGLFAQPLLLPALLTLVVGLILTIVGILVVPVAIVGFVLAAIAAVVGGYLAVARVVGEIYVKRTGRQDLYTTGWATYRYLLYGLMGLLAIWVPALALQWIPIAGFTLLLAAAVFTWMIATAGLGGVVLSRAGTRTTFGSKPAGQLSAEFSWTAPRSAAAAQPSRRA